MPRTILKPDYMQQPNDSQPRIATSILSSKTRACATLLKLNYNQLTIASLIKNVPLFDQGISKRIGRRNCVCFYRSNTLSGTPVINKKQRVISVHGVVNVADCITDYSENWLRLERVYMREEEGQMRAFMSQRSLFLARAPSNSGTRRRERRIAPPSLLQLNLS